MLNMKLMQSFRDHDTRQYHYVPIKARDIPERISAFIRVKVWGFCPLCNSDAPEIYDCPVCHWDHTSPFLKGKREMYWNEWKSYKFNNPKK